MRSSTYNERLARGDCPRCGVAKPTPGMKTCASCRENVSLYKAGTRPPRGPKAHRAPAVKLWRLTKESALDSRCRCGFRMRDEADIEHGCPFAPAPEAESAVMYLRSGEAADGGNEQGSFWGGRKGRAVG